MVKGKVLIIEGTSNTRNGILRQGFHKLLKQELEGHKLKIVMGDGKNQAIRKFLNYGNDGIPNLLIDLDKEESKKDQDLKENKLSDKTNTVFFMVQEMEAWFLSQAEILDSYYSEKISKRIPKRVAKEIPNPSDLLYKLTKSTSKGKYHKVIHAVDLLQKLDANKLMNDFDDFKELINTLKN